jgi:hypothetical protein
MKRSHDLCPPPDPLIFIAFGHIGSPLLLGILLELLVILHDEERNLRLVFCNMSVYGEYDGAIY